MVSRDKMKILEFGTDEEIPPPPGARDDNAMKIVEFDGAPGEGQQKVATAKDIGQIKILEFGDENKVAKPKAAPLADRPRKSVGAVKIKEFGEETEGEEPSSAESKIKIMEFD